MPQADTNSYEVTYEHFDSYDKVPLIISLMLSINYNVDLNAHRTTIPEVPPTEENPAGTPAQIIDNVVVRISQNGTNQVTLTLGLYLVWDNNWLSALSEAEFFSRYTPRQ